MNEETPARKAKLNYLILYVVLAAGVCTLISLLVRGPIYDPSRDPAEFHALIQSMRFLTGIYMNMLAIFVTIFSFFALAVFLAEQGHTGKAVLAIALSTAGMAMVVSILAVVVYLSPHIDPFFAGNQLKSAQTGYFRTHLSYIMAAIMTATFGTGGFLYCQSLWQIGFMPRIAPLLYGAYTFFLGILPLILVTSNPLGAQASALLGALCQIGFAVVTAQAAKKFRHFQVISRPS